MSGLDDASKILDYLPLRAGDEAAYIEHLWDAFEALIVRGEPAMPFAIMPFHLLFMLAVQYKVYRISAWNNAEYLAILGNCRFYDRTSDWDLLKRNAPTPDVSSPYPAMRSVRNLSRLHEKELFKLLNPIGIAAHIIDRSKELVDRRGRFAHANGHFENDLDGQIGEYLAILREIQTLMLPLNDQIADEWQAEIEAGESLVEFIESRLGSSYLCAEDFRTGQLVVPYGQTLEAAGII